MAITRIPFGDIDWTQSSTHPLEQKKIGSDRSAALLRFAPGFDDPHPCDRSHVLYVLEGELEFGLENGAIRIAAGEACWIDRGCTHHARNPGRDPVIVFIISDVDARLSGAKPGEPH